MSFYWFCCQGNISIIKMEPLNKYFLCFLHIRNRCWYITISCNWHTKIIYSVQRRMCYIQDLSAMDLVKANSWLIPLLIRAATYNHFHFLWIYWLFSWLIDWLVVWLRKWWKKESVCVSQSPKWCPHISCLVTRPKIFSSPSWRVSPAAHTQLCKSTYYNSCRLI